MRGEIYTDDLEIDNGQQVIGDTAEQTVEFLIASFTGEAKEKPLLGGNIKTMIGGMFDSLWSAKMRAQLKTIGIEIDTIKMNEDGITIKIKNNS